MQFLNQEEREREQRRYERINKRQEENSKRLKAIQAQQEKIDKNKKSDKADRTHELCQYGGMIFKLAGWTGDNNMGFTSGNKENFYNFMLCNKDAFLNAIYGKEDWTAELAKKEAAEKAESSAYVASMEQNESETPQTQPAHYSESAQNYQK